MAKQLLLRVRERRIQDELREATSEQQRALGERLTEVREEIEKLVGTGSMAPADPR